MLELCRFVTPCLRIAAAAIAFLVLTTPVRADDEALLQRFPRIVTIASTIPPNGDLNPYGIATVTRTMGALHRGNVLISNFNDAANLQGTGTTIVQIDPEGRIGVFAQINPAKLDGQCPGGVGLTTALVVLERGWVIVGSLPSSTGQAVNAGAGCLLVLDAHGTVVETFRGAGIDGPWDMTALDEGDDAILFVSNVLNGNVTSGSPHVVNEGTVLRIVLEVPEQGQGRPRLVATTVIGSGFSETADPVALVIGPTGLGLSWDGTLYVADTLNNRIAAIPDALTRQTALPTGLTVAHGGSLNGPLGLAITPNGNILTANAGDGNLVETTPGGAQAAVKTVDFATGAGSLFGLTLAPRGRGLYFVDDGDNTLKALVR
ncbi:conserved exported hypothetical protein [Burkholderiales bacterium]|nr:conserved exported hypothetical protein [Burkholderiales bacterium]